MFCAGEGTTSAAISTESLFLSVHGRLTLHVSCNRLSWVCHLSSVFVGEVNFVAFGLASPDRRNPSVACDYVFFLASITGEKSCVCDCDCVCVHVHVNNAVWIARESGGGAAPREIPLPAGTKF
jgi:hypothetical protein